MRAGWRVIVYICVCRAVNARTLKTAIDQGASTVAALQERLAVGTGCGQCLNHARQILEQQLGAKPDTAKIVALRPPSPQLTHHARRQNSALC